MRGKGKYKHAVSGEDYLFQRIIRKSDDECWNWLKSKDKDGYGQCHCSKYGKFYKVTRAHQLAYVLYNGEVPEGRIVCHTCDNPSCCNPKHLYAGTWKENVHDCLNRVRYRNGAKARKCNYKEVMQFKDKMTSYEVSALLGISFSRVCQIWRGEFNHANI